MYTIYQVFVNGDFTEGRGPMRPRGVFVSLDVAKAAAEQLGGAYGNERWVHSPQGGSWTYGFAEVRPLEVDETLSPADYASAERSRRRAKILSDMSPENRALFED